MRNDFDYINRTYGLSIKKGTRVEYTGNGKVELGSVRGTYGPHVLIRLDSGKKPFPYHPTWNLKYLEPEP